MLLTFHSAPRFCTSLEIVNRPLVVLIGFIAIGPIDEPHFCVCCTFLDDAV